MYRRLSPLLASLLAVTALAIEDFRKLHPDSREMTSLETEPCHHG